MENKFKFENLSEDKKKEVREQYKILLKLMKFSDKVNLKVFIKLFGEQIGTHLAELWHHKYKRDFLMFYNGLSVENQSIILCNIVLNENLYA